MIKKINYENKVSIQNDEEIKRKNKVTDEDMNEIKEVVNINAEELEDNKRKVDGLVDRSRGYSAYEIAVFEGFNGTKEEWLESLKGDKGDKGEGIVPDLVKTATAETIYLTDSAEMRFKKFGISGNSKQETRSEKNFLKNMATTQTINGITFTVNEDGTVTANGTATANAQLYVQPGTFNLEKGTYIMSGCPSGGAPETYYLGTNIMGSIWTEIGSEITLNLTEDVSNKNVVIVIKNGITVNNLVFKPMIRLSSADSTYEPYGASPSPDYPSEVKSCGDNINYFDEELELGSIDNTTGENAENNSTIRSKNHIAVLSNQELTILNDKQYSNYIYEYDKDKNFIKYTANNQNPYTFITSSTTKYIKFRTIASSKQNDLTTKFKLEKGKVATPYSPYGQGCINEVICNKNLFDKFTTTDGKYIDSAGGIQTQSETMHSDYITIKTNIDYYISGRNNWSSIALYDKNKIFLERISAGVNGVLNITNSNCKYIKINALLTDKNTLLLEEGLTATTYEEHQSQTYTIPTQQPFRAIGDIRDTFIKKDNKWYERHYIVKTTLGGTESWSSWNISGQTKTKAYVVRNFYGAIGETNINAGCPYLSDYFLFNENNDYNNDEELLFINENNALGIRIKTENGSDLTTFKNWLSNHNIPVYFISKNPADIECTPEQNEILDKIEQEAQTYKNVTHIYSTDEVKPVKDVEYYTDTQMNETFAKIQEMEGLKKDVNNFKEITVNVAQFGAVGNGITDDTEAIQNAINNAGFGGTVEFEKGKDYLVSSTIFVGIGQTLNFNFSNITPATNGKFTNNYVFSINSSDVENWDNAYSSRTTIINKLKADNINLVENLKLMYAPCNLKINWLFSRRFYVSVDSGNFYADMYELNDIYIYDNFGDNYAIYKRGQGDAFVVNKMLIGVFLDNSNMNAISVGSTAGCQLNDVIGGNYSFYNSRSVSINNAHIEVGRIVIKNSQVEINNSYLWKDGTNSTIEISDSAVANSKDINFPVVLNNVIFKIRNIKYTYTIEHGDIDVSNFNGLLELNNVMRVNEIDSNNYFYESITGISIKTATDTYINTVDNKTCIRNKVIEPVRKIFTTLKSGYYTLTNCSTFESDRSWQGTADKEYFYKVLVLNDTKRMCGINETNVTSATVKSATPTSSQNVLLNLGKVAGMSLRILRGSALNTFEEYVEIPFCQSRVLVDTGACINGFKWKTNSSGTYPTINNIFSEDFITNFDGNVHCFGKEKPTVGTWKAGDIVYDITGTTMGWRCTTAGTPGTWVEM